MVSVLASVPTGRLPAATKPTMSLLPSHSTRPCPSTRIPVKAVALTALERLQSAEARSRSSRRSRCDPSCQIHAQLTPALRIVS